MEFIAISLLIGIFFANNVDGNDRCYCSNVTHECTEKSFNVQPIAQKSTFYHGFNVDARNYWDIRTPCSLEVNINESEVGCHYEDIFEEDIQLVWELPEEFTGNMVKSYGGYLHLAQRSEGIPTPITSIPELELTDGRTLLYWNKTPERLANTLKFSVLLKESEWFKVKDSSKVPATREDLMAVLSNLQIIKVNAIYSLAIRATFIGNVSLDTAVVGSSGGLKTTQIEVCSCPLGYEGTSCELCSNGYFRKILNYETNPRGTCVSLNNKKCPCHDNEKDCSMNSNQEISCHCAIGFTGDFCQHTVAVRTEPMHLKIPPGSFSGINCIMGYYNYDGEGEWEALDTTSSDRDAIYIKWTRSNNSSSLRESILQSLDNIHFLGTKEEHNGEYICSGLSPTGDELMRALSYVEIISPMKNISTPRDKPRIILTPSHGRGEIGMDPTISCLAIGSEPITVTWNTESCRGLPPNVQADGGVLKFHGITESNVDRYVCTATNHVGNVTQKAEVLFRSTTDARNHAVKNEFIISIHHNLEKLRADARKSMMFLLN